LPGIVPAGGANAGEGEASLKAYEKLYGKREAEKVRDRLLGQAQRAVADVSGEPYPDEPRTVRQAVQDRGAQLTSYAALYASRHEGALVHQYISS
jgi:hypothetical protein